MDGTQSSSEVDASQKVFVIAATNRPNSIDDALRRPGRFDREFEIGIPDAQARLDILKCIFRNVPNRLSDDDIELVNSKAHGYVGADLAAVAREAALKAVDRVKHDPEVKEKDDLVASSPGFTPNAGLKLSLEDVLAGMSLVRPSVVREITVEVPKVRWEEIGGQDDIKQKLKEAVEWPIKVF